MKRMLVTLAAALVAALPLAADTPSFFVDYVDFPGNVYVDTEVVGRSGTRAELDLQFQSVGGDLAVLDARRDTGASRFYMFHSYLGNACLGYGDFIRRDAVQTQMGVRYLVRSDLRAGSQTVELDGRTIYAGTDAKTVDTGVSLYLGAAHLAYQDQPAYNSMFRVFGLKIWQTATTDAGDTEYVLVRDFRPCLLNAGGGVYRGALYDQVSQRVFPAKNNKNEDSGLSYSDVLGARVRGRPDYFVEYVESTGGQVLDTGVPARQGVVAEGDFAWTGGHDSEQCYLGCTTYAEGQTCYMVHRANNQVWLSYGDIRAYPTVPGTEETTVYPKDDRKHHFRSDYADKAALSFELDGRTVFAGSSGVDSDLRRTLTLFAGRRPDGIGFFASSRCYGLKMWLDGVLVRDFRPCVRDGRAGLYDAVQNEVVFPMGDLRLDRVGPAVDAATGEPFQFVEYVESDASQYVDTGVVGRSGTKIEADFAYQGDTAGDNAFIGCRPDDGNTRFFPFHNANSSYCYGYGTFVYAKRGELQTGTRHVVVGDMRAGSQTLDVDGARLYAASQATELDTGVNLYLFAVNYGGPKYAAKCRCYGLKIWQTATTAASDTDYALVRDFVPCRVFRGIHWQGALYDRVSGTVFACRATNVKNNPNPVLALPPGVGTTAAGAPDVFLEYVQSDGRQLLDTGVAAAAGVRAAGTFAWMDSVAPEQTYLGSYVGARMYMVHQAKSGKAWVGYGDVEGHRGYLAPGGTAFVDADAAPVLYAPGDIHSFDVSFGAGEQTFDLDGVRCLATAFPEAVVTPATLTLFGVQTGLDVSAYPAKARCYGLKLWKDGALVRDFRPCLKNGRAGLYDAVNDEVVFSSHVDLDPGLAGPVVDAASAQPRQCLAYLGSDGSAWLDTGVAARGGTRAEVEFAGTWADGAVSAYFGADMGLLGARAWSYGETRVYPVHVTDGFLSLGYGGFAKTGAAFAPGAFHVVRTELAAGRQTIELDGETVCSESVAASVDTGLPLYLFAVNVGGEAKFPMPARVRRVRIWQQPAEGGAYALVRDLRPVLLDGDVPAFYDAVSKTSLFGARPFADVGPVTEPFARGMLLLVR